MTVKRTTNRGKVYRALIEYDVSSFSEDDRGSVSRRPCVSRYSESNKSLELYVYRIPDFT